MSFHQDMERAGILEVKKSPKSCSNRAPKGMSDPLANALKIRKIETVQSLDLEKSVTYRAIDAYGAIGFLVSRFWLLFRSGFPFW